MNEIHILKRHPEKVLESLKQGEVESIELVVDQITDIIGNNSMIWPKSK